MAVAVSLGLGAGCDNIQISDVEYVQRAREYQEQGKINASALELKNALQQNPANAEARWLLGQLYIQVGNGVSAEKELRRALELGVPANAILVDLSKALLLQGRHQDILDQISVAGNLVPAERAELHAVRGKALLALRKPDEAQREFTAALQLAPASETALVGAARLAGFRNDLAQMEELLDKAVAAAPRSGEAWSLKGALYRHQGKFAEAEEAFGNAIANRIDTGFDYLNRALLRIYRKEYAAAAADVKALREWAPNFAGGHYAQGLLDYQQGRYAEAQTAFTAALKQDSRYMPASLYLGATLFALKQYQQAEAQLERYLRHDPGPHQGRLLLAAIHGGNGRYDQAQRVLEPYLQAYPDDAQALKLMGGIVLARGDTSQGIDILKRLVELEPDNAQPRVRLGLSLLASGETEEGLQELKLVREAAPDMLQADTMLILSLLRLGKVDQALEAAQDFQQRHPQNPLPLNMMGIALLASQEPAQARQAFQEALRLAPGDPSASINLAHLALADNDREQARSLYREVLGHHPGHYRTLMALAALEERGGDADKARDWLTQAMQADPAAPEPRARLAQYHLASGQPDRALELAQGGSAENADNGLLLQVLGEAQLATNQLANALATFEKLVRVQPRSADAHYLLARAYSAYGTQADQTRAHRELDEALRLNPNHLPAKIAVLRSQVAQNQTEDAARLLAELKQAHPQHPEVLAQEGWLELQQGRPAAAAEALQAARERMSAPNRQVTLDLALAQWRTGDQRAAIQLLQDWLGDFPRDQLVQLALANYYLLAGRVQEAQRLYTAILEESPDNLIALNNLASLLRQSDRDRARGYAERALEVNPRAPEVLDTLAMILLDDNEVEHATRLLQRAAAAAPENPSIQYHLAQALADAGDKSQARSILDQVLGQGQAFAEEAEARALLRTLTY